MNFETPPSNSWVDIRKLNWISNFRTCHRYPPWETHSLAPYLRIRPLPHSTIVYICYCIGIAHILASTPNQIGRVDRPPVSSYQKLRQTCQMWIVNAMCVCDQTRTIPSMMWSSKKHHPHTSLFHFGVLPFVYGTYTSNSYNLTHIVVYRISDDGHSDLFSTKSKTNPKLMQ